MTQFTKETFYKEAEEARKRFSEDYEGRDITEYIDDYQKYQYADYFMQYFHAGSVVGFANWEQEDSFCTWYSDAIKKIIIIDSDAYIEDESFEEFVASLWGYQNQAQELENKLSKANI